jgi:hypothetical protein
MLVSPAKVVDDPPNETAVEPNVTEVLASIVFETVALSPVPISVPVVIGNDKVGVPAVAVACSVAVPLVLPGNAIELIPVSARLALARPNVILVVPILKLELASIVFDTVALSPDPMSVPVVVGNVNVVVPAVA